MASTEFDFLDDFGISKGETPENVYEEFLKKTGEKVTKDLREYIEQNASNTGALASSIVYLPTGKLSFELKADFYYKFVDQGVNGLNGNMGSEYSFKLPYVTSKHARAIHEWKGIPYPEAYAVAMSIKKRGIKGKHITEKVITDDVLERIGKDLAAVTGLNFAISFEKNTQKWQ